MFLRLYGVPFFVYGFIQFLDGFVIRTFRAPLLGQLLTQFESSSHQNCTTSMNDTEVYSNSVLFDVQQFVNHIWNDPYWLASMLIVSTIISNLMKAHSNIGLLLLGSRMRVSCCSLIYRKVTQSIPLFIMRTSKIFTREFPFLELPFISKRGK